MRMFRRPGIGSFAGSPSFPLPAILPESSPIFSKKLNSPAPIEIGKLDSVEERRMPRRPPGKLLLQTEVKKTAMAAQSAGWRVKTLVGPHSRNLGCVDCG